MSHPSGQVGFSGHTRQTPSRRPKGLRPLLGRFAPEPRVTPISVVLLRTPPARRLRRAPAANTWPSEGRQGQRLLQATTVSDHRASSDGTCDLIWLHRSGPHELRNNSASTFGVVRNRVPLFCPPCNYLRQHIFHLRCEYRPIAR